MFDLLTTSEELQTFASFLQDMNDRNKN